MSQKNSRYWEYIGGLFCGFIFYRREDFVFSSYIRYSKVCLFHGGSESLTRSSSLYFLICFLNSLGFFQGFNAFAKLSLFFSRSIKSMTFISLNFGGNSMFVPFKFLMSDNFVLIRVMPYGKNRSWIVVRFHFQPFILFYFITFNMKTKIKKTEEKYSRHIHRCS